MQLLREKHLRRCFAFKRLARPGFILSWGGLASSVRSKYAPREDALHHSLTRAPSQRTRTGESGGLHRTDRLLTGRPRLLRGSRGGGQVRAPAGAGPARSPRGPLSPYLQRRAPPPPATATAGERAAPTKN